MRMRVFAAAALLGGLIAIPVMQAEAVQVPAGLKTTAGMTTDLQLVGGGGGHGGGGGGGGHMGSFAGRAYSGSGMASRGYSSGGGHMGDGKVYGGGSMGGGKFAGRSSGRGYAYNNGNGRNWNGNGHNWNGNNWKGHHGNNWNNNYAYRHRHYGNLASAYGYYGYGDCYWLLSQANITGSPYWWSRYNACVGYY
jgi:hypothetical protein